jgi:maleamate amidohydrolase
MSQQHEAATAAAIAEIRRIYEGQNIRSTTLGFGRKAGVLVVDFQHVYTRGRASTGLGAVEATARLISAARQACAPIYYTVVAYDDADKGRVLWTEKLPGLLDNRIGTSSVEVDPLVAPQAGDMVIEKKAASAFLGTGLRADMDRRGVDTLVVAGTSTSGCVRASVVDGMGHNVRMIIARECVSDRSAVLHELTLFDLGSKYADVTPLAEILAHFSRVAPT